MHLVEVSSSHYEAILLWGVVGTVVASVLLEGAQGLGWSRLSLPFLFGTLFTGNRRWANAIGFTLWTLGGWLFALLYFSFFAVIGHGNWVLGGILGLLHGLFLMLVFLPLLSQMHPRMATPYDGPAAAARIEPPGFLGLNYGRQTPLTTLVGMFCYGALLGLGYQLIR